MNKNSGIQQQQSENGIFSHNLKKLFSMYKEIKERLENMCEEQET